MEKRSEHRLVPPEYEDALVEICNQADSWKGWVVDISAGGLRALIPHFKEFLDPGDKVSGWIFGRSTEEIKIRGHISWVKDNSSDVGHHVGVKFSQPIRPPHWVRDVSMDAPIKFSIQRDDLNRFSED